MANNLNVDEDDKYKAPALDKGLDILETLADANLGLTQSELARKLKRSVGEIFRMLMVLRKRNLIELDELSDRYFLTTKLFELAHKTPIIKRLTSAATPIMQQFSVKCNQSIHLSVQSDKNILIVGQVDNPGNNVFSIRIGARTDIWKTSSGRLMLAFKKDDEIEAFLKESPHPDGQKFQDLIKHMQEIRQSNCEISPSYVVKGITNISAPVFDHDGYAIAALTIPYLERLTEQVSIPQCTKLLIEASQTLSKHIGGNEF
ncbi:MAG: IclR family transcriptional regulator [Rhizobiales bacterium]|nr:IclR family transcriptional regulator [Hyphomicrobiales bacterium]NRB12758.1 IclR family transcriptional regulator [Hyphomicrobiales bacterium]